MTAAKTHLESVQRRLCSSQHLSEIQRFPSVSQVPCDNVAIFARVVEATLWCTVRW